MGRSWEPFEPCLGNQKEENCTHQKWQWTTRLLGKIQYQGESDDVGENRVVVGSLLQVKENVTWSHHGEDV